MPHNRLVVKERFYAVVNLRECDLVPVSFPLSRLTARHANLTMADVANDCETNATAVFKTYHYLGGIETASPIFLKLKR